VCTARQRRGARHQPEAAPPARQAAGATAADALSVLAAARTLPFPVGKTGLVRLLAGSITSPIKADRSQQFGALAHLPASRVEALIERLIEAGYLARDEAHEFRLLSITDRGRAATAADLAALADPLPPPKATTSHAGRAGTRAAVTAAIDMDQWDAGQHALFERLRRWRHERAQAEGLPAYIIMPNEALIHLVARQPRSAADFAGLKGFGPARAQRYGEELLSIINGDASAAPRGRGGDG
jgi:ATP-dependent DNA helicase RecQ